MIRACICGSGNHRTEVINDIPVDVCKCGIVRQHIDKTNEELFLWYRDEYFNRSNRRDYAHNRAVAELRFADYSKRGINLSNGTRSLDVGSGDGSYVDVMREKGVSAYGCDPHNEHKWTYPDMLRTANFPPEHFDLITFHDSLEHIPDPAAALRIAQRILKPDGQVIVDFPSFFCDEGKHHWKLTEHLWFLTHQQLTDLVQANGFRVVSVYQPIPSKIVIHAERCPLMSRARILVPPGIGDTYWVLCKLESIIKRHELGVPEVWVASINPSRDRSFPYLQATPFLKASGYFKGIGKDPLWKQAYMKDSNGVFRNVLGFDFFLSANGPFRFGKTLEQIMPEYETNWYPPMFLSLEDEIYGQERQADIGDYIVAFFTYHGMYKSWLHELPPARIYQILAGIHRATGKKIILSGAKWDLCDKNAVNELLLEMDKSSKNGFLVDMIGRTSLPQFFALLKHSSGCIGFCGGNTIMATVLKKPTVILWNSYYSSSFWSNSCPPDSLGRWYTPLDTKSSEDQIRETFLDMMRGVKGEKGE